MEQLTTSTVHRIQLLMEEYNLFQNTDNLELLYLLIGYSELCSGDKETYMFLNAISTTNKHSKKNKVCIISIEDLSSSLKTSQDCQVTRLKKLRDCGLVEPSRRMYNTNKYKIYYPQITKSFAQSILKLIRKNRLNMLISKYNSAKTIEEKLSISTKLEKELKRFKKYPEYTIIRKKLEGILQLGKSTKDKKSIQQVKLRIIK